MTEKMGICIIKYTYERYVGIDVEKLAWKLHNYAEQAFAEFHPMVSEPGNGVEMPDYVDVMLCKKDGSSFDEADIRERAVRIPHECMQKGVTLTITISIQNSDGTSKKRICVYSWASHSRTFPLLIEVGKRTQTEYDKDPGYVIY